MSLPVMYGLEMTLALGINGEGGDSVPAHKKSTDNSRLLQKKTDGTWGASGELDGSFACFLLGYQNTQGCNFIKKRGLLTHSSGGSRAR